MPRIRKMIAWLLINQVLKGRKSMDTKKPWASTTVIGWIVAIITTALQMTGTVTISDIEQGTLVDMVVGLINLIAQLVGFIMVIVGRWKADKPLSVK